MFTSFGSSTRSVHASLVLATASELSAILGDTEVPRGELDRGLQEAARRITGFGNLSPVVTVFLAAVSATLVGGLFSPRSSSGDEGGTA